MQTGYINKNNEIGYLSDNNVHVYDIKKFVWNLWSHKTKTLGVEHAENKTETWFVDVNMQTKVAHIISNIRSEDSSRSQVLFVRSKMCLDVEFCG